MVLSKILPSFGAERGKLLARRRVHVANLTFVLCLAALTSACAGRSQYASPASVPDALTNNEDFNRQLAVLATQSGAGSDYSIGPEDLLDVTLFDLEDEHGQPRAITARVSSSGDVALPYIGKIMAAGFTPLEFESQLREAYRSIIHEPQLTVFVREYRSFRISVIGYVNSPGVLDLKGRKTLLEVLAMAGGLTNEAGKNVRITRSTAEGTHTSLVDLDRIASDGDASMNLDVLPGDVVTVPKAGTFYVEGVVKKPGAYPLLQQMTLSQAVATAGGPDEMIAKTSGTRLYRKSADGERVMIPVDLAALQKGKGEDLAIREDDVIVVPMSAPRFWIDRLTAGVLRIGLNAPLL